MKLNGSLHVGGAFNVIHKRGDQVLSNETYLNTTTKTGFAEIAGLINGATTGGFTYIELDGSGTATTAGSTANFVAKISALGRAAATCSRVTTTNNNDTAQLLKTFTATGTQTVKGVGIFDASSDGIMAARTTFSAKNMESGDTLQITYKVKVS